LGYQKQKRAALPAEQLRSANRECSVKRRFPGPHQTVESDSVPDGVYLVRVQQAQYRWNAHKAFYGVRFGVIEPKQFAGRSIQARLYCAPKALWKLSWFLQDFRYDSELLGRDELDEKALVHLIGVVQLSHVVVYGTSLLDLEAFAPAAQWNDSTMRLSASSHDSEVAS
jgi:hypothetical protein